MARAPGDLGPAHRHLASVKVGRRRVITRQHLQQFPGIAS